MPAEAKNIVKNVLNPEARASPVSESGMRDTVVVSTIAMASENMFFVSLEIILIHFESPFSCIFVQHQKNHVRSHSPFKILSPKTNMFNTGSTSMA